MGSNNHRWSGGSFHALDMPSCAIDVAAAARHNGAGGGRREDRLEECACGLGRGQSGGKCIGGGHGGAWTSDGGVERLTQLPVERRSPRTCILGRRKRCGEEAGEGGCRQRCSTRAHTWSRGRLEMAVVNRGGSSCGRQLQQRKGLQGRRDAGGSRGAMESTKALATTGKHHERAAPTKGGAAAAPRRGVLVVVATGTGGGAVGQQERRGSALAQVVV
jgi:hypothetical protein